MKFGGLSLGEKTRDTRVWARSSAQAGKVLPCPLHLQGQRLLRPERRQPSRLWPGRAVEDFDRAAIPFRDVGDIGESNSGKLRQDVNLPLRISTPYFL